MPRSRWDRMTPEQRQRRVQQLITNPNTRASIPSRYLPAAQRRQREMNQQLDRPVVEGSQLTNRMAGREAENAASVRYGPLEQQLNTQLQRSQQVQQAIPQWYEQYRQLIGTAQEGIRQGFQAAQQQQQALQAGAGQVAGQGAIDQVNQQIQQLGGQVDPQNQQIAANAAAVRAGMAGNIGAVTAAQAANQNAYAQNLSANTPRHQIDSIMQELGREREIQADRGQLARERGAYRQTQRQGIRDREQRSVLERAAFNLDVANTAADNARADEQLDVSQRSQRRQEQQQELSGPGAKYGYTATQWRRMSTQERQRVIREFQASRGRGQGGTGQPRQEPVSSLNPRRTINSRVDFVRQYARDNNLSLSDRNQRARLVAALRRTHRGFFDNGGNERMLSAALDLAQTGKISNENLRFLRRQGVYVTSTGDYWGGGNRGGR